MITPMQFQAFAIASDAVWRVLWRRCSSHAPLPIVEPDPYRDRPKQPAAAWKKTLKVECPHCGEVHRISVREAYVKFAIQDGTDPIVVDRPPGVLPRPPKGFIPRKPPKKRIHASP